MNGDRKLLIKRSNKRINTPNLFIIKLKIMSIIVVILFLGFALFTINILDSTYSNNVTNAEFIGTLSSTAIDDWQIKLDDCDEIDLSYWNSGNLVVDESYAYIQINSDLIEIFNSTSQTVVARYDDARLALMDYNASVNITLPYPTWFEEITVSQPPMAVTINYMRNPCIIFNEGKIHYTCYGIENTNNEYATPSFELITSNEVSIHRSSVVPVYIQNSDFVYRIRGNQKPYAEFEFESHSFLSMSELQLTASSKSRLSVQNFHGIVTTKSLTNMTNIVNPVRYDTLQPEHLTTWPTSPNESIRIDLIVSINGNAEVEIRGRDAMTIKADSVFINEFNFRKISEITVLNVNIFCSSAIGFLTPWLIDNCKKWKSVKYGKSRKIKF